MTKLTNNYNLEEKTAKFGESVIKFCKTIKQNSINNSIVNQLIRSATSIGANYMEANGASSRKDFKNKIHICKKESQETKHWLRMMASCDLEKKEEIKKLWEEAQELTFIFGKIISTLNKNSEIKSFN
ncbi:four helix bundle protein [Candidatus Wolfebacteria bacterium]|nr:four helix bundle protein [Candidatus Wolfebacteria bacterium]